MRKILPIVFALAAIYGCGSESSEPEELIAEETYERMFIEFAIINQMDEQLFENRSQEELRQMVYSQYGVTEEEFRISHEYYEQNVDEQLERVKEITRLMQSERDSVQTIQRQYEAVTTPEQLDSLRQSLLDSE